MGAREDALYRCNLPECATSTRPSSATLPRPTSSNLPALLLALLPFQLLHEPSSAPPWPALPSSQLTSALNSAPHMAFRFVCKLTLDLQRQPLPRPRPLFRARGRSHRRLLVLQSALLPRTLAPLRRPCPCEPLALCAPRLRGAQGTAPHAEPPYAQQWLARRPADVELRQGTGRCCPYHRRVDWHRQGDGRDTCRQDEQDCRAGSRASDIRCSCATLSAVAATAPTHLLSFADGVKYYKCDITDAAAIAEVAKQVRAEVRCVRCATRNAC